MKEFYEVCKVLISTDASIKDEEPCVIVTGIDSCTQKKASSVEFDYTKVFNREDTYGDIAGFYHTHPSGMSQMSSIDVETMKQWVNCLGKGLVCLIETDESINGWLFHKDEEDNIIKFRKIQVDTKNDVNYELRLESENVFWNISDFLLEESNEEIEYDSEEDAIDEILETMHQIKETHNIMIQGFNTIVGVLETLIKEIKQ